MGDQNGFRGLRLTNTMTRQKEDFVPFDADNVRVYVCGPTVYDYAHIGNARPIIVFDVLYRLLCRLYGADHVTYVRNVTDVDDKINARAAQEGISIRELTERTVRQFHADIDALRALRPNVEPRATDHIEEMKTMIAELVQRGHAYVAADHVLFDVPSMPDYGRLSNRSLDEMQAGARVEVATYKRDPMDFVLWKPSRPGEPAWPSPCGIAVDGRPGWHIECSAMSEKHLGPTFDIHGGGIDLVFPHHENELAQSRCAHGTPLMAKVWLHNGFLQVEGEKMSKSLGNFTTIHDLLADWPGEVLRLNMLRSHYRQPIDWTVKGLEESRKVLDRWYAVVGDVEPWTGANPLMDKIAAPLLDDLNTPMAITVAHGIADEVADDHEGDDRSMFKSALSLLGLLEGTQSKWQSWRPAGVTIDETRVAKLIAGRAEARKTKNWAEADRVRGELDAMGVVLKDGAEGTTWELKR
ncbi:cysteinyl-tRNA synthetase [Faunimonas pinastri]|uniref:Cysteine--tRNA ligase n=1 Tax=Faunimonas pinastri TaxID=1855383 RepID=A0A1H9JAS9_9HYPH|nr:cysteine--tRNA ligase [Faunimonas pinastri]SEQ83984.1 cysteinyl-tRNA synthetase [Faunimonas pinastri]